MATIDYSRVLWADVNSNFGEDVDPEVVTDVQSINNSLFNIFRCPVGSRPFEREYGSSLMDALFEPTDSQTADFIDIALYQAIRRWEPRIKVDTSKSFIRPFPSGDGFDVRIVYIILKTRMVAAYDFSIRRI